MLKALLLWLGAFGLLLSLLGLLGAPGERSPSGTAEPSTYSEPEHPGLPTASENQTDALQNMPTFTF